MRRLLMMAAVCQPCRAVPCRAGSIRPQLLRNWSLSRSALPLLLPATPGRRYLASGLGHTHLAHGLTANRRALRLVAAAAAPSTVASPAAAPAVDGGYRCPPPAIQMIVDSPAQPSVSLSPNKDKMLFCSRPPNYPPISELARPELKLAGMRLDAETNSRSRMSYYTGIALADIAEIGPDGAAVPRPIEGIPAGALINYVSFSPTGTRLAFTVRFTGEPGSPARGPLRLWIADVATRVARPAPVSPLNCVFENYAWVDDDALLACVIPPGRPETPPVRPRTPTGPKMQDNKVGSVSQAKTYPDLLKDAFDCALFDHHALSELRLLSLKPGPMPGPPGAPAAGECTPWGPPGSRLHTSLSPSPDSTHILVDWLEGPYSYNVPCGRFARREQMWTRGGGVVAELASLPLAEDIPIVHDSVRRGVRGLTWRPDAGAEVTWVESRDGGDPRVAASPRDVAYTLSAAAAAAGAPPRVVFETDFRYSGISWGTESLALASDSWYKTRGSRTFVLAPGDRALPPRLLWDRSYEDAYSDPGWPISRRNALGMHVLATFSDGDESTGPLLLLQGDGSGPEGDRPFLDALDPATGHVTRRVWRSAPPAYEQPGALMAPDGTDTLPLSGLAMLVSSETNLDPPQTSLLTWRPGASTPSARRLTAFPHPHPQLRDLQQEIIRYKRSDGVDLTATLYTPPGYDAARDGPLPCLLWCYPREFKSAASAGQLRDSPHRFSAIGASSPLPLLAHGYAVLDGPTMPIVGGDAGGEPNDTYVEQLVASAEAAVAEVVRRGVADPTRVAVGGHSYGAFTTANLLAHCPALFACGVARSGAYNRTLTPFGFQAEERTLWQAAETYTRMSPFMLADKIAEHGVPLLLIHGEDDDNVGTFPMQSERFYAALKGHGAPARLVVLPHESHGYRGRESLLHMLAEMANWLDEHTAVRK